MIDASTLPRTLSPAQAVFEREAPTSILSARPALVLALALHGLVNAVKYGALSKDGGYVEVVAPVTQGEELRLRWHERNGPPVAGPSHKGFGSRLIERNLARQPLARLCG
jgi:two-component sensor histidine kinase